MLHLEKATVSTGKEGLLSEGNNAYNWSRCVDELESLLLKHGSLKKLYFYHQHLTTVTKIGRDAVLYVESLIESIMGGLEGLINILDSEGGFGALENQLLPEQAAMRMNQATKISLPSAKSPRGISGLPLPGHESYPENNNSVKMLEAAMQRLTNLCSVLNDMEPICVLNHVFVLREYMRECILGNFKRRLLGVLKTDNDLQRPSLLESLLHRHMGIVHLAEQHISMDLTQGIREVLLSEAFTGPVSSLHSFEKSTDQQTGSAIEIVCNWYIENIVKDGSGAGILFAPIHKCFKSARPVGGYFAESVTDIREMKAFVRIFGGYGVDRLDRMMREHMVALLNCIDTALRSNREALEGIVASMQSGDRIEREANLKQIVDMETLVGFCIQAGQALDFVRILAEAAGSVLEESVPLVFSLIYGVTRHLPDEIPEKEEIRRLRRVASSVGVVSEHDTEWMRSILLEAGGANDGSWSLLPYLCAGFMTSNIWNTAAFNINTGGFNNNIHCLARCINAVIAGSELVRLEREEQQRQPVVSEHTGDDSELNIPNRVSAETSIKSAMQLYLKCSSAIALDPWTWSDGNRSPLVAKLIFFDQLCEFSPYIPRSTLELHIPYAILRSIYRQCYANSPSIMLALLNQSPRQSPAISLTHASPLLWQNRGDSPQPNNTDSGYFKGSSNSQDQLYEAESASVRISENKHRHVRRSGPLEYSTSRKVKFIEGSHSGSTGPSPLPRFAVSRSGPLAYK
ncbi:histone chaperone [Asimina triloba]